MRKSAYYFTHFTSLSSAVIGEVDPEVDEKIDFTKVKAEPLPPLVV